MIVNIESKGEIDVRYLQVDAGVRYYEDTVVNGEDDIDLMKTRGKGSPRVPCAVRIKDKPHSGIYSDHYRWRPLIDVNNGQIVNWERGTTAEVLYKVCDNGHYSLLDQDKNEVISVDSYVPELLCPEDDGFGDYINFDVDADGFIKGWKFNQSLVDELVRGSFY